MNKNVTMTMILLPRDKVMNDVTDADIGPRDETNKAK